MLVRDRTFGAIADPTRRAILDHLRLSPAGSPVTAIAAAHPMSRPAVSKHLRVLRQAGLVREQREGRRRIYRLHAQPLLAVDDWLVAYRQHWAATLLDLKTFVESQSTKGS